MRTKIIVLVVCCIGAYSLLSAAIKLETSREKVGINETFTALFTTDVKMDDQPDFTPLDADFDLLSVAQNHQVQFINGHMERETSWKLVLRGKHAGTLTIPSIVFGQESSPIKTIEITPSHLAARDDTIFLETEVSPNGPLYEQMQLTFAVRLYRSVNLAQGSLSDVKASDQDALIERLGNDSEYEYHHSNGVRYVVLERKYSIIPQHAGELQISPIVFEGQVIKGGHSFFNLQSEFKRLLSEPVTLTVKSIPPPFQRENWFPANDVQLTEEWSVDPEKAVVGEPVTWTLTVIAEGCLASQIPSIALNIPQNVKQYMDKPHLSNEMVTGGNRGIRQNKIALIGTKAGEMIIPEINLQWWDVKEEKLRTSHLPARTMRWDTNMDQLAMNTSSIEETEGVNNAILNIEKQSGDFQSLPLWAWCLIGLNALWIIPTALFLYKKMAWRVKPVAAPDSLKKIKEGLKQACRKNNAKEVEALLLAWATVVYPQVKAKNLIAIKEYLSEPLNEAVDELYQALYGRKNDWQGESLWLAFACFKPQPFSANERKQSRILRSLYPETE